MGMLMTEYVLIMLDISHKPIAKFDQWGLCPQDVMRKVKKCSNKQEMWSQRPPEAVSEVIKLKIFLGVGGRGIPPDTRSLGVLRTS